jgi:hypothetical protein
VESCFSPFGDSVSVVQSGCTVCAECTIGSEIILDALDNIQGDEDQVEACLSLFGDSANLDAR